MEERTIIPIDVVQREAMQDADRKKDEQFRQQWRLDDYPACPVGMSILRRFAEAHPQLYADYVTRDFSTSPSPPAFKCTPRWLAYLRHCESCDDCREV